MKTRTMKTNWIVAAAVLIGAANGAPAPDFGAWCSDVAHYDANRCLENRPEDRAAYESFLTTTASFEGQAIERDNDRRVEAERTDRMGDVTPDQTRDRGAARDP